MPLTIYKISDFDPSQEPFYFCDTNVWITALRWFSSSNQDKSKQAYLNFVDAIINLNEQKDPAIIKRIKFQPKIILTSLLLSEIINTYMRSVAMCLYFNDNEALRNHNFKKEYRDNPKSDYSKQLKNLISDIISFQDYTVLMDDEFQSLNPYSFLQDLSNTMDFNDAYYGKFLKSKNIPFVTDDNDCKFQDVKVITYNYKLLKFAGKN